MKHLFNRKIPTILGIGLVAIGIIFTTAVINFQTNLRSKASNSQKPQNVKITNITNDTLTITYQTEVATTGSVNFGKTKELGITELDDADKQKGSFSAKTIHSMTIKKLSQNTKYYFVIISGENTYLNNDVPFEAQTAADISSKSALTNIVKGKVILPDGNPPEEAMVYLSTDNSQILSTLVDKDGQFSFSLKNLRSKNLSSHIDFDLDTILKLQAISGSLESTVLLSPDQLKSIPAITLSNNYDFVEKEDKTSSESGKLESGFPSISTKPEISKPQILTPTKDQSFTDKRPLFRGKSLPNEKVEIIINSEEEIRDQVVADDSGNWSYRPPADLSPGEHTITVLTRDASGILRSLTQSFTVYAQSPSATPTQKPTPTPTLIPFTPFPETTVIPTSIPTLAPAILPSPTTMIAPESKGGLPPTGNESLVPIAIGGFVAAITGIIILLLM